MFFVQIAQGAYAHLLQQGGVALLFVLLLHGNYAEFFTQKEGFGRGLKACIAEYAAAVEQTLGEGFFLDGADADVLQGIGSAGILRKNFPADVPEVGQEADDAQVGIGRQINGVMAFVGGLAATKVVADDGGGNAGGKFLKMKAEGRRGRGIVAQQKAPQGIFDGGSRCCGVQHRSLVTEADAGLATQAAGPGRYGFKIGQHQVVVLHGQLFDLLKEAPQGVRRKGAFVVDAAVFPEGETESPQLIFYLPGKGELAVVTADKQVGFGIVLQNGHNFTCPGQVSVAGALYGIEYFHVRINLQQVLCCCLFNTARLRQTCKLMVNRRISDCLMWTAGGAFALQPHMGSMMALRRAMLRCQLAYKSRLKLREFPSVCTSLLRRATTKERWGERLPTM